MKRESFVLSNEEVILTSFGFIKDDLKNGWKSGFLNLTNLRLFFLHSSRNICQIFLSNIVEISIQQKEFIQRRKDALCLSYRPFNGEELSRIWIILKDIETWEKKIFERSLLKINQEAIDRISMKLDPENRNIVLYVWQNRYATIEELASLCNASNHMDALFRISDVVNPLAEKIIGSPLLVFEKSKIDPETGKKILFSWWLIGGKGIDVLRGTIFDIFDEGNSLRIILELFGVSEESIQLKVNQNRLIISAYSPEKKYQEEILLPVLINSKEILKRYKNGILEVRLKKEEGALSF